MNTPRNHTLPTLAIIVCTALPIGTLRGEDPAPPPRVPSIDAMASQWLDVEQIVRMPSMHNFHEMAACAPGLLGVNYCPGGQLYGGSGPRWYRYRTVPLAILLVDGQSCEALTCRWYPYQASPLASSIV
ncbi:MAG: hypothetical protein HQ581_02670 [Planctomycetes bacterium]|nr:hypothetical protein [Planctomycetota bacterium]